MQIGLSLTTTSLWCGLGWEAGLNSVLFLQQIFPSPNTTHHKKHSTYSLFRSSSAGVSCVLTPLRSVDFWKLGRGLRGGGNLFQDTRHSNVSHLWGWNNISIVLVCVFSADVLWWLICAFWNRKFQPLLGVNWISLGQALLLECAGSPMGATLSSLSLVFWFQSVIMKWVPLHPSLWPINQRRTLLGWVLVSLLYRTAQYLYFSAVLRHLQGKSLPLSLRTAIRRILWLVLGT